MKSSNEFVVLDAVTLATTHGGMRWEQFCQSYNVEDRRRGAGTPAQQRAQVDEWNRAHGCATWADLHPRRK